MSQGAKLVAALVLIAFAGMVTYSFIPTGSALSDDLRFICVETGEVFTFDRDQPGSMFRKNPSTGNRSLLPVSQADDGSYYIHEHYRGLIPELEEFNQVVDPVSLKVRAAPADR